MIYVCGDASHMEPDVHQAFCEVYQAKSGVSPQEAQDRLSQMEHANRYLADAWAAT
jgi:sulfite reductase (NADPH) flavoprotein alpha-component